MEKLLWIEKKIKNKEINVDSIMYFIIKYDIIYNKNENGVFVNLSKIKASIIDKLYDYIQNYINNNMFNNEDIKYYKNYKTIHTRVKNNIKYKINTDIKCIEKKIIKLSKDI